jgi:class 3 adenylate cyclase
MSDTALRAGNQSGALIFTDLVGFSDFTYENGDDAAVALLSHQDDVVHELLPAEARVVKELGDGLFIWFADPTEALEFTVAFRDVAESDEDLLWIRAGLHWGCPQVRGDDLIGNDVNLAARIMGLSAPSEILVSEALREAVLESSDEPAHSEIETAGVVGRLHFDEIGPVMVKGIGDPVRLFRVCEGAAPSDS